MTVRIDTLRNRVAATSDLLALAHAEAEDLHALAYDRARAAEQGRGGKGRTDYALDTHGDPRARKAYQHLGDEMLSACGKIADAIDVAQELLGTGEQTTRGKRKVTGLELAMRMLAQGRRSTLGDFQAFRRLPQPDAGAAMKALGKEHERLASELDAAHRVLDRRRIPRRGQNDRQFTLSERLAALERRLPQDPDAKVPAA